MWYFAGIIAQMENIMHTNLIKLHRWEKAILETLDRPGPALDALIRQYQAIRREYLRQKAPSTACT